MTCGVRWGMTRAEAGRLGAEACRLKYGNEFFRINGARGGRPRQKTLVEIREEESQKEAAINERRRLDTPGAQSENLAVLKRLWKSREEAASLSCLAESREIKKEAETAAAGN